MSLVRGKLNQHKERLRLLFRQMDINRNSLIDKEEFVAAIQALRMQVSAGYCLSLPTSEH